MARARALMWILWENDFKAAKYGKFIDTRYCGKWNESKFWAHAPHSFSFVNLMMLTDRYTLLWFLCAYFTTSTAKCRVHNRSSVQPCVMKCDAHELVASVDKQIKMKNNIIMKKSWACNKAVMVAVTSSFGLRHTQLFCLLLSRTPQRLVVTARTKHF